MFTLQGSKPLETISRIENILPRLRASYLTLHSSGKLVFRTVRGSLNV
jgi:hypothetical protein